MAKQIVWTPFAQSFFKEILSFFNERNGNSNYSKKLLKAIKEEVSRISIYPELGLPTQVENVRILIFRDYKIIYKDTNSQVVILLIWDSRMNPKKLDLDKISDSF